MCYTSSFSTGIYHDQRNIKVKKPDDWLTFILVCEAFDFFCDTVPAKWPKIFFLTRLLETA